MQQEPNKTELPLNKGQQAAADGFFKYLLGDQKELKITGPGGVGKTHLITHLINKVMPEYQNTCSMLGIPPIYTDCFVTATTNKAAEVLRESTGIPTNTVQSFMNLIVSEDHSTGRSFLRQSRNWKVHGNTILFVDEASIVDSELRKFINEGTFNCKIIWVGDHCQLGPIGERISPVFTDKSIETFELTEPVRNAGQPDLIALCTQLRYTVEHQEFFPIVIVPGVIDLLTPEEMEAEVSAAFQDPHHSNRILAYTNEQVVNYNLFIRGVRNMPSAPTVGEIMVNNSAAVLGDGKRLSVEQPVEIARVSEIIEIIEISPSVTFEAYKVDLLINKHTTYPDVFLPVNRDHFQKILKYLASKKEWPTYFKIKEMYPDLRPTDASTVHKAQGSTYETVYIDAANLSKCHDPVVASRLLYVAASRAKTRIAFYGELAPKYGGYFYE